MRKISTKAVVEFSGMTGSSLLITCLVAWTAKDSFPIDFRGVLTLASAFVLFYFLTILLFRLRQRIAPIPYGNIKPGSAAENTAFVYMLHYILLFNPLIYSRLLPYPVLGGLLRALGAKIGANSFCSGLMMDPQFVQIGNNSLVGNDAMLIAHVIEGDVLAYEPIVIGDNVTIGARAIIMAGVTVDDGAIIGVQSVVSKGSHIKRNETWVGCQARCIR